MSTVQNPEAYTPQLIALGPCYPLRPELYQMERYKLAAIKEISTTEHIFNFQHLVINKLKEIDPCTRACYNKFMDHDQDTSASIFAIDGCFFLHIARSYVVQDETMDRRLLDNTIVTLRYNDARESDSFILLKEIRKSLRISNNNGHHINEVLIRKFVYSRSVNISGFMNSLISTSSTSSSDEEDPNVVHNNFKTIMELVEYFGTKRTQVVLRPVKMVSNVPWPTMP
ncbi:hypothetical protein ACH5RR_005776 [Cinchona calisaya]|uniref:Uncharacterized protein n=1 Tax=Cinchona calisaya TaxID=153742 RepID=A0ABD3AM46_9GENT